MSDHRATAFQKGRTLNVLERERDVEVVQGTGVDSSGGEVRLRPRWRWWPVAALALAGCAAGCWLGGAMWPVPVSPVQPVVRVLDITPEQQIATEAGAKAEAARAALAEASRVQRSDAPVDEVSPGVTRLRGLQAELEEAETKRLEGAGAVGEVEPTARHREELLRIAYEGQLAMLPVAQQSAAKVGLLKSEAELGERVYQAALARAEAQRAKAAGARAEEASRLRWKWWSVVALHRGVFGLGGLLVGLLLGWALLSFRDARARRAAAWTDVPHGLSWAEEAAVGALEEKGEYARLMEPVGLLASAVSVTEDTSEGPGDHGVLVVAEAPGEVEPFVEGAESSTIENALPVARGEESVAVTPSISSREVVFADAEIAVEPERVLEGVLHGTIPLVQSRSPGLARVVSQDADSEWPQSRDVFFHTQWGEMAAPLEEACRDAVYSMLLADWGKEIRSYAMVSPRDGDGKTTVLANMAVALGRAQLRVVLVEANLRSPRLNEMFDVERRVGLRELLRGDVDLDATSIDELTNRTTLSHVAVVPAGVGEDVSHEWAESPRFAKLMERLTFAFDLVLVDTATEDAVSVARQCGAAILLSRAESTETVAAAGIREALAEAGVAVSGVVVNGLVGVGEEVGYVEAASVS